MEPAPGGCYAPHSPQKPHYGREKGTINAKAAETAMWYYFQLSRLYLEI